MRDTDPLELRHRIGIAKVNVGIPPPLFAASWRVVTNDKPGEENAAILGLLGELVSKLDGPVIIGGDWNISLDTLQVAGWADPFRLHLVGPGEATRQGRVIDFMRFRIASSPLSPKRPPSWRRQGGRAHRSGWS